MKTNFKYFAVLFVLSIVLSACSSVPVTGRKQLNIIPSSQMMSMSYQQYDELPEK